MSFPWQVTASILLGNAAPIPGRIHDGYVSFSTNVKSENLSSLPIKSHCSCADVCFCFKSLPYYNNLA